MGMGENNLTFPKRLPDGAELVRWVGANNLRYDIVIKLITHKINATIMNILSVFTLLVVTCLEVS